MERIDGRAVWRGKRNVHGRGGLAFRDEEVNTAGRAEADAPSISAISIPNGVSAAS